MVDERKLKLKYIFETHLHADFVSGHLELSKKSGAEIVFGHKAGVKFDHVSVREDDILTIGNSEIRILETPGHTPEGICYVGKDLSDPEAPLIVFTGDTLFAGDVGRPDLMDEIISVDELGRQLYHSLREKLMILPDSTKVYPAHGAGSSCGRALLDVEFTTIGTEKATNYALQEMDVETFIEMVGNDQPIPPSYFQRSAILNKQGLIDVQKIVDNLQEFDVDYIETSLTDHEVSILDVRHHEIFAESYIPGSYNIGLNGRYAEWIGSIIDPSKKIILIADPGTENEAAMRAGRVGYDNVIGYLKGGFDVWEDSGKLVSSLEQIDLQGITSFDPNIKYIVLDVRRISEFREKHVEDAKNIPLVTLQENLDQLSKSDKIIVHCQSGYRSTIAASILAKEGFENVLNLKDGIAGLIKGGYEKIHLHN